MHCLVLDGVYRTSANGEPEFVEIPAPSDEDIWEVLQRIIKRVMKQLVRRGILVEDQGEMYLADDVADSEQARTLRPLQRGSCVYRIAFGPRAGQKVLTLQGALPREVSGKQRLCGFHGVLAPNAKLRAKVVPRPADEPAQKESTPEDDEAAHGRPMRLGWAKLLKRVFSYDITCKQVSLR